MPLELELLMREKRLLRDVIMVVPLGTAVIMMVSREWSWFDHGSAVGDCCDPGEAARVGVVGVLVDEGGGEVWGDGGFDKGWIVIELLVESNFYQ